MSVINVRYEATKSKVPQTSPPQCRAPCGGATNSRPWSNGCRPRRRLIALSPLFVVIAGLIAVTAGRPVIYRRRVVGRGGGEFDAFKFRTMVHGAERVLEQDERLRRPLP